jgi:hypothetical protein
VFGPYDLRIVVMGLEVSLTEEKLISHDNNYQRGRRKDLTREFPGKNERSTRVLRWRCNLRLSGTGAATFLRLTPQFCSVRFETELLHDEALPW